MAKPVRILGAGLSGLSAAINLVKNGVQPEVLEKNKDAGLQIQPNFQVLQAKDGTPADYLAGLNLYPNFRQLVYQKALFSTSGRDLELNLKQPVYFIQRGGERSLEAGLKKQAEDAGVRFQYDARFREDEADIIATGPKRVDASAYGEVFETDAFPQDRFLLMYDDRYSPKGWYLYAVPCNGKLSIVNCASQPHTGLVKERLHKALEEKKILKEAVAGKKPVGYIGGFGNAGIPKTAVKDGRIYTGEAAGFQDPFRGFGMKFALESGKLAADALAKKLDYDALWKKQFAEQFKLDYSRRFFLSIFGSRIVDLAYRNTKNNDAIDFKSGNIKGPVGGLLKTGVLQLELLKQKMTGRW